MKNEKYLIKRNVKNVKMESTSIINSKEHSRNKSLISCNKIYDEYKL